MVGSKDGIVFDQGYDRRQWNVTEPSYGPIKIDPREINATKENTAVQNPSSNAPSQAESSKAQDRSQRVEPLEPRSDTGPITEVYDAKNQLTSLVRNAKHNEEAIRVRNERIKQSKLQSRNRYGW